MSDVSAQIIDAISKDPPNDEEGNPVTAMLTKCVLVIEWVDGKGQRYLTRRMLMADGSPCPAWDASGMLYEALNGGWQER